MYSLILGELRDKKITQLWKQRLHDVNENSLYEREKIKEYLRERIHLSHDKVMPSFCGFNFFVGTNALKYVIWCICPKRIRVPAQFGLYSQ